MTSLCRNLVLFAICGTFSACVTTREQYNEERGIHADDEAAPVPASAKRSVQSEDLPTAVKAEPVKPEVPRVETPPPLTAPPVSEVRSATRPGNETPTEVKSPSAAKNNFPGPVVGPVPPVLAATPVRDVSDYGPDELRAEVARLTGQVEELQHDKETADKGHTDEKKKAEDRVAELEKKLKELQPDVPKVPEGKTALEAAKESFANTKYDETILYTGMVLEKSESGKEAEEATYLRGEAYFKKQLFNKAIVDYSHFPEKFQKSSFHPKALLRIAESFEMMGRKDDAKAFYSDLLDKFPKTAEGKLAKKRLKIKK